MQRDIEHWKPNEVARLLALVETERRYYQDLFSGLPVAVAVLEASGAFIAVNREFRRVIGIESPQLGRARLTDYVDAPGLAAAVTAALLKGETPEPLAAQTRAGENISLTIAPAGGWSPDGMQEVVIVAGSAAGALQPAAAEAAPSVFWRTEVSQEPAAAGDIFAPDLQPRQRFYLDRPRMSAHESFDYRVRTPQGRLIWLRDHSLMEGSSLWGFTIDVTEGRAREAAQNERQRREAVERLAARVAHVSNNLLMIINGYGEEILSSLHEADTRREDMEEILKASGRLASLTQELSALARPAHYDASVVALEPWLPAATGRLLRLMPEGVSLTAAPATGSVVANPELLEQMLFEGLRDLSHLLRPEDSCLIEVLPVEEARCRIAMSLHGVRIDEEAAARLFEPFSGPKLGTDPPLGIAGLLRPFENLGGSVFWDLSDPVQPRLIFECASSGQAVVPTVAVVSRTVLVVEDEPSIRQLIVKSLERHGYSVLQASGPIEALSLTATQTAQPDLLVTDLMVPCMDGRTFAARLREKWPALPVLYVSGFTGDPELTAQLSRGALPPNTRFLAKPFGTRDLLEAVSALLARGASASGS
jgi:CheY-like chemotaxis protein